MNDTPIFYGGRTPKPHRHAWLVIRATIGDTIVESVECQRCGKSKDEAASRRSLNNAKRGKKLQREGIRGLGGTNLPGNAENLDGHLGDMFAFEWKSGGAFPIRLARWLRGIPHVAGQVQVLGITETPGPGHKARRLVVVDYDDWRSLHGGTE